MSVDYQDQITFLAVAGRSNEAASRDKVGEWFSPDRILWGYDESVWEDYGVFGQPASVLIAADGTVVGSWYGAVGEESLREALDFLVDA